jgi:V8-like Glu-specific endopeptidase
MRDGMEFDLVKLEETISKTLQGSTLESILRPLYYKEVMQGVNIIDIGYPVCAIFILKRCLDKITKEYCKCNIKSSNLSCENLDFAEVERRFWGEGSDFSHRCELLSGRECSINEHKFSLKSSLLTNANLEILKLISGISIDFENGVTEYVSDDNYNYNKDNLNDLEELSLETFSRGVVLLVKLEKELMKQKEQVVAIQEQKNIDVDFIVSCTVILESESICKQGTAFCIGENKFLTCYHNFIGENRNECNDMIAFSERNTNKTYNVKIINKIDALDLALIEIEGWDGNNFLQQKSVPLLQHMDDVIIIGYPNYRRGDEIRTVHAQVASSRMYSGIRWILLNQSIIPGNSGGPVLSGDGKRVVGIAARGGKDLDTAADTEFNGVIPISAATHLFTT